MLKSILKKIQSAPKLYLPLMVLTLLIIAVNAYNIGPYLFKDHKPDQTKLLLGSRVYYLDVVTTAGAQEQGLSGRVSLPHNQGMLFDFGSDGERCMWMKDMQFPLDMIWADSNKTVTAIERNVAPSSYPTTYCKNARYVVELNVGTTSSVRRGDYIRTGDHLNLQ